MNRDNDFIGRLEDYLESFDGPTPLPDRVRYAIRADVPRTRQVPPARGMGRMLDMMSRASAPARWGLAAAVVVVAVVLGAAVINNGGASPGVGSAPITAAPITAAPTTAASPSPSPTPTPALPLSLSDAPLQACYPGGGVDCLEPGTYRLTSSTWPGPITLDVPAGWFQWRPAADFEGVLVDGGPAAPTESGWGLMVAAVADGAVSIDPCDPTKGLADRTSSVDGLVAAMSSWPGFQATAPTPITVDGFSGQMIELTAAPSARGCSNPVLWTTPGGWAVDAYPIIADSKATAHRVQFRILDVDGSLLVIRTTDFPETSPTEAAQGIGPDPTRHAADQVELHQILDSIRVTGAPLQP
jgi:hypothetical protein